MDLLNHRCSSRRRPRWRVRLDLATSKAWGVGRHPPAVREGRAPHTSFSSLEQREYVKGRCVWNRSESAEDVIRLPPEREGRRARERGRDMPRRGRAHTTSTDPSIGCQIPLTDCDCSLSPNRTLSWTVNNLKTLFEGRYVPESYLPPSRPTARVNSALELTSPNPTSLSPSLPI